jgi:hypothetical protein
LTAIEAFTEWEMPGVVEADARLAAPLINPAKAAAATKPVVEPKIFVLRFIVYSFQYEPCASDARIITFRIK